MKVKDVSTMKTSQYVESTFPNVREKLIALRTEIH
jgi:hypothetical protein